MIKKCLCPVAAGAQHKPHAPAIITTTEQLSYFQLNRRIIHIQKILRIKNYSSKSCLAVKSINSITLIALIWACFREGLVLCLINDRLTPEQYRYVFNQIQPDEIIENLDVFSQREETSFENIDKIKNDNSLKTIPRDKPALIILTSGSSGVPKAVVLSYENFYFNALGAKHVIPIIPADRWLLSLPLFHVSGLGILFRVFIAQAAVVMAPRDQPLSEIITKKNITHISVVSSQLIRLLQQSDTSSCQSLKAVLLGGGIVSPSLVDDSLKKKLPLFISYGLTEMASQVATSRVKSKSWSAEVLPYREVYINRQNEILVKGKTLFLGYWDKGKIFKPFTGEGWFATGDIGDMNAEGKISIWGRKDNMFKSRGEKVFPEEIERELIGFKGISKAVIIPHAYKNEDMVPIAFLGFAQGAKNFDKKLMVKYLSSRLEKFKIPVKYYFLPEDIKSSNLKVNRQALKKMSANKKQLSVVF
jgi:o-succinylbenzoate---CoA ligase